MKPEMTISEYDKYIRDTNKEQNLLLGVLLAIAFGLLGALLWGFIAMKTGYTIGYIAIGIGFMVSQGFVIGKKGFRPIAGIMAVLITLLSILLGEIFYTILAVQEFFGTSFFESISVINFTAVFEDIFMGSYINYLFFFLGASIAYKRSFFDENKLNITLLQEEQGEQI